MILPPDATTRRYTRLRRGIGVVGAAGLASLAVAYWLTVEPAPRVRILWRPETTSAQRAAQQEQYLLLNERDQLPEGSIAYDLLDVSPSNLKALVEDPAILDTNDIERHTLVVPFDGDYGTEWMWIAHRIRGLRDARVRAATVVTLAAMALGGLAGDARRSWRAVRSSGGTAVTRDR